MICMYRYNTYLSLYIYIYIYTYIFIHVTASNNIRRKLCEGLVEAFDRCPNNASRVLSYETTIRTSRSH